TLSAEQALAALATGIVKVTTASGVLSTAVAGTDYETAGTSSTHAALTAAHGATGAVVGTTNVQTLTNKTLTAPAGIVKADVGLGSVDNTADSAKPVSTAQQTALDAKSASGHTHTYDTTIPLVINGGGAVITTGVKPGDIHIPAAGTIVAWHIFGDQASGSIVVDVWKDTYANFPPTVTDTITGTAKPTISAANKGQNTAVSWAVAAGDVLRFNVDSASTHTSVTLNLVYRRTV
ncbi:MAG: hypothetical protein M3349_04235, partial [Actinomycetota bacterium]|nr:hypothetical protein [Actinomycetota bacterium]